MTRASGWHLAALLLANFVLALGPWAVRLADSGPVAAGFWRLMLPLPLLFGFALASRQRLTGMPWQTMLVMIAAGVMFAADLGAWHIGIAMTRLGNAALFGNSGSLIVMVWGLMALGRRPNGFEWSALAAAMAGAVILFGRSLEIGQATLLGDLFCLFAGLCYAFYIIVVQRARAAFGTWALVAWSSLAGAPVLLGLALALGEPVWPHTWWPLIALALGSQVIGQGLLVLSLKHFRPLVIGLVLMTQPAVAAIAGWLAFGERLTAWDGLGMVLVAAALAIARAGERSNAPA
ncbi:DMT family transporter [Novosphingobium piscinae]|uniref:DMT family transporter n=1 Tax=Novosphingobium piscinae TaxID=1507448 RepID=UPI001FECBE40|nr:DMT family transporter [Novosphingobium piscinae]